MFQMLSHKYTRSNKDICKNFLGSGLKRILAFQISCLKSKITLETISCRLQLEFLMPL